MKQVYSMLIAFSLVFLISGCTSEESDNPSEEKGEVYITAGLKARPLTDVKFESTPERIARGKYLAEGASHCFLCHSVRDWSKPGAPPVESMKGAGSIMISEEGFMLAAPNITPDVETGAGTWTDDMFARAIREGVGHDGRPLFPLMRYEAFRNFTDEDIASVVVYLRTLPPVKNKLPKRKLPVPVQKMIVHIPVPVSKTAPEPDFSNALERGKYLVEVGDCAGCHTSWDTPLKPGFLGGGMHFEIPFDTAFSVNITPDKSGLFYDEDTFLSVIKTGKGGTLHSLMPWIAVRNYSDDDLRVIYQYLRTIKPVRHYIDNHSEPTYCKLCGQMHGLGNMNTEKEIKTADIKPAVYKEYSGTYSSGHGDSLTVFIDGDSLKLKDEFRGVTVKLLPVSSAEFASSDLPFNIRFSRNGSSQVSALSYHMFNDVVCGKVK